MALLILMPLSGCSAPEAVRQIQALHPAASYEAFAKGCDRHPPPAARRFGSDLHAAVLWGRQVVGTARTLPCEVSIQAVTRTARRAVYHLARTSTGQRTEQALPPR